MSSCKRAVQGVPGEVITLPTVYNDVFFVIIDILLCTNVWGLVQLKSTNKDFKQRIQDFIGDNNKLLPALHDLSVLCPKHILQDLLPTIRNRKYTFLEKFDTDIEIGQELTLEAAAETYGDGMCDFHELPDHMLCDNCEDMATTQVDEDRYCEDCVHCIPDDSEEYSSSYHQEVIKLICTDCGAGEASCIWKEKNYCPKCLFNNQNRALCYGHEYGLFSFEEYNKKEDCNELILYLNKNWEIWDNNCKIYTIWDITTLGGNFGTYFCCKGKHI